MTERNDAITAVIVGSRGQDGYYLSRLLRSRGARVIGVSRGVDSGSGEAPRTALDVLDPAEVARLLAAYRPEQVYYLAAVHGSAEDAAGDPAALYRRAAEVHVSGLLNFLDGAERHSPCSRIFYAASSHVFGNPGRSPQNEDTPLAPVCIYGITKSTAVGLCRLYRARGSHCSAGILYNHESARRPPSFVSRKIVRAAVDIKTGGSSNLVLGDLEATVDWGAAEDYVDAMARILELDQPGDFVVATGRPHTVRDFVATAFSAVGLDWEPHVRLDRTLLKGPARALLLGDSSRLRSATGWQPRIGFEQMVRQMLDAEFESRKAAAT